MIKISILVPIYNVAKYIECCVVSLMEQTYKNIEYIFVNDCTPDNSIDILNNVIKKYPNRLSQIKIISHEYNKGLAGARITALNSASGDYIFHVDADDYITHDAIEKLTKQAIKSNADIVDAPYSKIDGDKVICTNVPYRGTKNEYLHLILGRTGLVNNQIWGKLIKKALYVDNNINAIEGIDYGEDYSVFPKILLHSQKRVYIDSVIYYYNISNTTSYMHSISKKAIESYIKAEIEVYDYFKSQNKYIEDLQFSLDFGFANLYNFVRLLNLPVSLIDNIRYFHSDYALLNLYISTFRHHFTFILGRIMFIIIKRVYYKKFLK